MGCVGSGMEMSEEGPMNDDDEVEDGEERATLLYGEMSLDKSTSLRST